MGQALSSYPQPSKAQVFVVVVVYCTSLCWHQAEGCQKVLEFLILFCNNSYGGLICASLDVWPVPCESVWGLPNVCAEGLSSKILLHWPSAWTKNVSLGPSASPPVSAICLLLYLYAHQAPVSRGAACVLCLYSAACQCLNLRLSPPYTAAVPFFRVNCRA